ncbi:MAG: hypothetical protein KF708_15355 [Pirellulales bacterium]|nr:hypothetical protein [Pirellulales bacterium]
MPRRNSDSGDDVGLDSLLDTMFNVLGILVLVLILTQIGAREAAKRIAAKANPARLAESREKLEDTEARRRELAELLALDPAVELERVRAELAAHQEQLADLERQTRERVEAKQEQDKNLAELTEREKQLRTEIEQVLAHKASLETLLAKTPAEPAGDTPDAEVVYLPNPRSAPEGAQPVLLLCRDERLYPLDVETLRQESLARALEIVRSQSLDRDPQAGIDAEKLIAAFNARKPNNDYFRVSLMARGPTPWLVFERRQDRGHPALALRRRGGNFQRGLSTLNPAKQFANFLVWPDSFEVYLAAREVVASAGLLAGWAPQTTSEEYATPLGGDLRFGPPPPPPMPNPNPPPPAPVTPPRPVPSDTVD